MKITLEMIVEQLELGSIRVFASEGDFTLKCKIGEYWFYFMQLKNELDKMENYSTEEIAKNILTVLSDASDYCIYSSEAGYYESYILEKNAEIHYANPKKWRNLS